MKSIIIFFIGLYLISCTKKESKIFVPAPFVNADTSSLHLSMLSLGDSYTIGTGVATFQRWPYLTKINLIADKIFIDSIKYIATIGWKSSDLMNGIDIANDKNKYDIVTLLIGVNDQYTGVDTNVYRQNFSKLLNTAIGFSSRGKKGIIVLSLPDYSYSGLGSGTEIIQKQIDLFNMINYEIANMVGVNYVYITELSRLVKDDKTLTSDGLHPSEKQYQMWANAVSMVIKSRWR